MWKNAFKAAAAALCLASPVIAAESSRLSAPNLQADVTEDAATGSPATLRPARIGIVEDAAGSKSAPQTNTARETAKGARKPTPGKATSPKQAATRKPAARKPQISSRRTASPHPDESAERKITFRPAEVVPLQEESRRVATSRPSAPVGEVQYPVMPSDSRPGEWTAEYEEDDTAIVFSGEDENLAPIVSAADMPRPGRVRPAAGSEGPPSPDLSLPPLPAAQAQPEKPVAKEPGRLSNILSRGLRLPEFRSRKSSE